MKKIILTLLFFSCFILEASAIDKRITASNTFKFGIFDTSTISNGVAGLTLSDIVIKVQCASTATTINETGDTLTDELGGYYRLTTNDVLTPNNEDECFVWVEGSGNYLGLLAKAPVKFKVIGATMTTVGVATNSDKSGYVLAGTISGTAQGGSTSTTIVDTVNLTSTMGGAYIGGVALVDGETAIIKSFNSSTDTITLASTLSATSAGKTYYLIPQNLWEILSRIRASK